MQLTEHERGMLSGKYGQGVKQAMEILTAYGDCNNAGRMIPITSVHIAGNYPVLLDEGIEWLENIAAGGTKVKVLTTVNPEMYDFEQADALDVPTFYRERQKKIDDAFKSMGITLNYTCHHYLVGNVPRFGDHIAWASSGSQVFANSIIGARSNRDGDHVAIAAAITGVIPEWGLHITENRRGDVLVDLGKLDLKKYGNTEYKTLGWLFGRLLGAKNPVVANLPPDIDMENVKGIMYTMTVTGGAGLVHFVGITPEAPTVEAAFHGKSPRHPDIVITQKEVDKAFKEISSAKHDKLDLVIFGCPHCTIRDVQHIVDLLDGRKVHKDTRFWICTSRWVKTLSERMGLLEKLQASGGHMVCDTAPCAGPYWYLKKQGVQVMAINSAKANYYAHGLCGMETWFGSTEACVESAISGKWEGPR